TFARAACRSRSRRHRPAQCRGEPPEEINLRDRLIIDRVVDFSGPPLLESGNDGAHQVVAMNHVKHTLASAFDGRFALQVLLKPVAALRPINPRYSQDHRWQI